MEKKLILPFVRIYTHVFVSSSQKVRVKILRPDSAGPEQVVGEFYSSEFNRLTHVWTSQVAPPPDPGGGEARLAEHGGMLEVVRLSGSNSLSGEYCFDRNDKTVI